MHVNNNMVGLLGSDINHKVRYRTNTLINRDSYSCMHIDAIYFAHAKQRKGQRLRYNVVSCKPPAVASFQLTDLVDSKFLPDRPDRTKLVGEIVWCLVWFVRRRRN